MSKYTKNHFSFNGRFSTEKKQIMQMLGKREVNIVTAISTLETKLMEIGKMKKMLQEK